MPLMVVKIYKSLAGRSSSGQWSNSYEIETDNAIGSAELDAEADVLVAFERSIHTSVVHFMRVVVSTFAKEGRAGHPEAVKVRELSGTGALAAAVGVDNGAGVMPTDIVLEVKRIAGTGRTGRLLYRGALNEDNVQTMGNGRFAMPALHLTERTAIVNAFNDNPDKPTLVLASYGPNGEVLTRPVVRLEVGSIIVRKRTSRRRKKSNVNNEGSMLDYLDEALGLIAGVATFVATKSPGMSAGARAAGITAASGLGSIIGNIIQTLTGGADDGTPVG